MVIGVKFLVSSAVKGDTDNLLIVLLKIVEHLQLMHGLEKSQGDELPPPHKIC